MAGPAEGGPDMATRFIRTDRGAGLFLLKFVKSVSLSGKLFDICVFMELFYHHPGWKVSVST